ncbi:uncharacterized protein YndB with AHSA1/START domain [Isoptericola jiangsuensis]|uniref:Uncharacterized protein YndB with AHSA1/START domain n=1 Tax=Isoptericola jiangsuensis TaxID=548579 RepID=A0A2A9EXI7_9MICO|nr:SRPBCC domain-containing protein [Isoptericola jiangsuensis]PFG43221.1 uncharacterized protein YndB with AHSA1/START domain [Isoptericola jiangsuensis]
MVDILHRIGVKGSASAEVFEALTTVEGLARWWTEDVSGGTGVGEVVAFRFGSLGGFDMRVLVSEPGRRVVWEVVDGPPEWVGTHVSWDVREEAGWTVVLFAHTGWAEPVEFMHHCSTKWATFLMSLKGVVEQGVGAPAPRDVAISDWH